MPGPGPHMMYALATGQALTRISAGRFSPHHSLVYAVNAFFGPDLGSFSEWLSSTLGFGKHLASLLERFIHDPFFYILILGFPLSLFYARLSKFILQKGFLDSFSPVPLTRRQCLYLVSAGSLSHFFLDHLFEENGHSTMYTWILSTGWWNGTAQINSDAVMVIGLLCTGLISGFIYINRVKSGQLNCWKQSNESLRLIGIIASLYCLWCASQIYLVKPRRAAVGEEADLGVILFMAIYFFLPHGFCIASMNTTTAKDYYSKDTEPIIPL